MSFQDRSKELDGFEVGSGLLALIAAAYLAIGVVWPGAHLSNPISYYMPVWGLLIAVLVGTLYSRSN